jgi:hypothetical protein
MISARLRQRAHNGPAARGSQFFLQDRFDKTAHRGRIPSSHGSNTLGSSANVEVLVAAFMA